LDANTRLRIATRIHFALMRHLGEGFDIGAMLRSDAEAREVLWVCQASGDRELMTLARQYERADMLADEKAPGGHHAQDTAWAGNTSGFGVTQPPPEGEAARSRPRHAAAGGWLNPAGWLRRSPR